MEPLQTHRPRIKVGSWVQPLGPSCFKAHLSFCRFKHALTSRNDPAAETEVFQVTLVSLSDSWFSLTPRRLLHTKLFWNSRLFDDLPRSLPLNPLPRNAC